MIDCVIILSAVQTHTHTINCSVRRNVNLSVSFPKTLFRYWSSRALQRGVECSLQGADLSLSLNLALVTVDSALIQRQRANWTVRSFSGCGKEILARIKRRTDLAEASTMKVISVLYMELLIVYIFFKFAI